MVFGAMVQSPDADNVRHFKAGVLRDTYRNLYATTMKTWHFWIPRELGRFSGSDDRPAVHDFSLDTPYGAADISVEFRALGQNSVEATARGWELNGAYLDEADLMPQDAIGYLGGRVQRAGDVKLRQSKGVWFTFNKPDVDHFLYDWCEDGGFEGDFEFFDQPGGLLPGLPYRTNPDAENLKNLDPDYYVISAQGQKGWYVKRMIRNQWGASVSGEVVYQEFGDGSLHMSPLELEPGPGQILKLGLDGGGTPAAVIFGRDMLGRRVVYAELVLLDPYDPKQSTLATGVGPTRFGKAILDLIQARFRGCRFEIGYGDPAAFYGADREAGEYSFMETVAHVTGIAIIPADSNEIALRHDAVHGLLQQLAPDGKPCLIVNPSCRWLRKGFTADYKWQEADPKQPGKRLVPQKSKTSHVHDALQYGMLGDVGRAGVVAGGAFDRWQPKHPGSIAVPDAQRIVMPWDKTGLQAVVKGTHYGVKFNPWG